MKKVFLSIFLISAMVQANTDRTFRYFFEQSVTSQEEAMLISQRITEEIKVFNFSSMNTDMRSVPCFPSRAEVDAKSELIEGYIINPETSEFDRDLKIKITATLRCT